MESKFNGAIGGIELYEFRRRVECMARIENVSEEFAINGAFHLFDGEALLWYMQNQHEIMSWEQMIHGLSRRFVNADNAFIQKINAENRLQGKYESY